MYHYYMFNKPFGCVCARRDDRYPTVMDYFSDLDNPDLSPVGRLDRATEGLLLVTDDGMFNQKLTHPSYKKEKTYLFTAMGTLSEEDLYALEHGVQLTGSDRLTAPAHVCVTATSVLKEVRDSVCKLTYPSGASDRFWRDYRHRREKASGTQNA